MISVRVRLHARGRDAALQLPSVLQREDPPWLCTSNHEGSAYRRASTRPWVLAPSLLQLQAPCFQTWLLWMQPHGYKFWFPLLSVPASSAWGKELGRCKTSANLAASRHQQVRAGKAKLSVGQSGAVAQYNLWTSTSCFLSLLPWEECECPASADSVTKPAFQLEKSLLASHPRPSCKCVPAQLPDGPFGELVLPSPAETRCPTFTLHHEPGRERCRGFYI